MIVTAQDFDGYPYNIPNLDSVANTFAAFVDAEEETALINVLGRLLYTEFKIHLDASVLTQDPVALPERWALLKNGTDYVWKEKPFRWDGLSKLLKPFIYARWTEATSDSHSGLGIVVPKTENSNVISSGQRVSRAHNVYSRLSGHNRCMINSLYGYLYNSEDVYLDVVSEYFENIQEYMRLNYKDPGLMNMFSL